MEKRKCLWRGEREREREGDGEAEPTAGGAAGLRSERASTAPVAVLREEANGSSLHPAVVFVRWVVEKTQEEKKLRTGEAQEEKNFSKREKINRGGIGKRWLCCGSGGGGGSGHAVCFVWANRYMLYWIADTEWQN